MATAQAAPRIGILMLSPRNLRLRQRNELDFVARHLAEVAGRPFGFGLLDPILARRNEVPPDMPWPVHGGATQNHHMRVGHGLERDVIAWAQHQEALAAEPVATDIDLAVEHINRAL